MEYRREIDGLRAISVIAIILFHTQNNYFRNGFIGVDLFFVISGYLITRIIVTRKSKSQFSLLRFYLARARRLLPALLLMMLVCIPFALTLMFTKQYKDFSQSLIAANLFGSNILFWLESQNYFSTSTSLKPLLHTWSLSVEEQFYFIYPPLLLLLLTYAKRLTVISIVLLTLCFAVYSIFFIENPLTLHYLPQARFWLFGVGALIFFTRSKWLPGKSHFSGSFSVVGIILLIVGLTFISSNNEYSSVLVSTTWSPYISILGIILLLLFSDSSNSVGRLLSTPVLSAIGIISYSLYLWHYPVFAFAQLRLLTVPMSIYFLLIVIIFLISYFSWRFIEMPFRNQQQVTSKHFILCVISSTILILSIGTYGVKSEGYVAGMSVEDRLLEANYGLSDKCQFVDNKPFCEIGGQPEILVWGDSFAMHSVNTILTKGQDIPLIQLTVSGCSPIMNGTDLWPNTDYGNEKKQRCLDFNQRVLSSLKQWSSLEYVVISSRFSNYFNTVKYHQSNAHEKDKYFESVLDNFVNVLSQLTSEGLTPIIISEPRRPPESKIYCAAHKLKFQSDLNDCDFSSSQISESQAKVNELLREVELDHKVVWLDDFICTKEKCTTLVGKTAVYTVGGHLSAEGASLIGDRLEVYKQIKSVKR